MSGVALQKKDDDKSKTEGGTLGRQAPLGATSVGCPSGQCKTHITVCLVTFVVKIFDNALTQNSSLLGSDGKDRYLISTVLRRISSFTFSSRAFSSDYYCK